METGSISQFNVLRTCDSKKAKFGKCCHANRRERRGQSGDCASHWCAVLRGLVKCDCTFRVGREEDVARYTTSTNTKQHGVTLRKL